MIHCGIKKIPVLCVQIEDSLSGSTHCIESSPSVATSERLRKNVADFTFSTY